MLEPGECDGRRAASRSCHARRSPSIVLHEHAERDRLADSSRQWSAGHAERPAAFRARVTEAQHRRRVAGAGLPFERIDLSKGLDGGFDGKLLQTLTPDFCKKNGVVPLRMDGGRVVLGVTRPDDVFLLDEIKGRLQLTLRKKA